MISLKLHKSSYFMNVEVHNFFELIALNTSLETKCFSVEPSENDSVHGTFGTV